MSNNLVSKPLMIPNKQMDPIPNNLEVPIPDVQMEMMGGFSNSRSLQQIDLSHKQMGIVQPISSTSGFYDASMSNKHVGQRELQMSEIGLPQHMMPNQHDVGSERHMLNNQGSPKISLPCKRTADGEAMLGNFAGQQLTPSKNLTQINPSASSQGMRQQLSKPSLNKKLVRNESISGRSSSKQVQTPKSRVTQMEPSPRNQAESFESVRSKMRESLASALALVAEQLGKASRDAAYSSCDSAASSEKKESNAGCKALDGPRTQQAIFSNEGIGISAQNRKASEPEFQYATALSGEEGPFADSFFVQDELLQGNGLTWAMDLEEDLGETKEEQIVKKPRLVEEDTGREGKEEALQSPESLASKIEAELFKLFGGVNKKYKEKGRSLLFNLKDHNNPELRERVMSGEISPERLCTMSAEELASKELSEWRMAKAEELAQMVVLPDSDVDMRRLVKKTHKGEFQVEVEQDDGVSVEVSVGTSAFARPKPENKDAEAHHSLQVDGTDEKENVMGEKISSENQDLPGSIMIPNDASDTDLMQGLMADEFKDTDLLPPIVSLDEFMQSLDSEPPFENLHVDDEKKVSPSDNDSSGGNQVTPSDIVPKEPLNAAVEISDKADIKHAESNVKAKLRESPVEEKISPSGPAFRGERVWEGILQLNMSAGVNAAGFFRSGEKTSTKEWPHLLEIKGRVRLDAFEKFIQDLPMSRSRAVMVVHFALKEGSSDADLATFGEAVHSYVLDERLGIAEPVPGAVEIYFCPPHPKILDMLGKHLPRTHTEILKSIQKGLIGVIVWRRAQISSAMSPNSSTRHKHTSKKPQHFTSTTSTSIMTRGKEENNMANVNIAPQQTVVATRAPPHLFDNEDEDDDIPPGFGPAPPRTSDEDDLPEFNFSGGPVPKHDIPSSLQPAPATSSLPRPVDHMRELVLKYGQIGQTNKNNNDKNETISRDSIRSNNLMVGVKNWNEEDEDDDIPEWQPSQQTVMSHRVSMHQPWVPRMQRPNMVQGGRWVNQLPGPGSQRRSPGSQQRQLYGVQKYPRTRGF